MIFYQIAQRSKLFDPRESIFAGTEFIFAACCKMMATKWIMFEKKCHIWCHGDIKYILGKKYPVKSPGKSWDLETLKAPGPKHLGTYHVQKSRDLKNKKSPGIMETLVTTCNRCRNSSRQIFKIYVVFSEYMNFMRLWICHAMLL